MAYYDILGNIAIIKSEGKSRKEVLKTANELLKKPSIKTVVEKVDRFKGRLRTIKVRPLLGEKNLIAEYKENGCVFRLDVGSCYFSTRLANERAEIASKIKKKDSVLVMFAGVGPFSVVIAKLARPKEIVSIELGREVCKYAKENSKLNKVDDLIDIIQGDVKKQIPKLVVKNKKFDVVVMARPNLADSFFKQGLEVSKKGTIIYYYGFSKTDEVKKMVEDLEKEAFGFGRKIKVLRIKQAGEIAPFKYRYRIEIKVLN